MPTYSGINILSYNETVPTVPCDMRRGLAVFLV